MSKVPSDSDQIRPAIILNNSPVLDFTTITSADVEALEEDSFTNLHTHYLQDLNDDVQLAAISRIGITALTKTHIDALHEELFTDIRLNHLEEINAEAQIALIDRVGDLEHKMLNPERISALKNEAQVFLVRDSHLHTDRAELATKHLKYFSTPARIQILEELSGDIDAMLDVIKDALHVLTEREQLLLFNISDTKHGGGDLEKLEALVENAEQLRPKAQLQLVKFAQNEPSLDDPLSIHGRLRHPEAIKLFIKKKENFDKLVDQISRYGYIPTESNEIRNKIEIIFMRATEYHYPVKYNADVLPELEDALAPA